MIDAKFVNSDITTEEMLTHATKQAEEVSQSCPHALDRVGMNFTHAVTIIIPRPLLDAMGHRRVSALDCVVAIVFIGVHMRTLACKLLNMLSQGFLFGIQSHPQAHLPSFSPNRADDWRPIIGKRATSATLIGPTTWWVSWIEVLKTFFPPRSGTSRRFPFPDRVKGFVVVRLARWLARRGAVAAPSGSVNRVRLPAHWMARPSKYLE